MTGFPAIPPRRLEMPHVVAGLFLAVSLAFVTTSGAQTSARPISTDPATLSLTTGTVRSDGSIGGSLSIDLQDGWKTYWIDPGSSGIAPKIEFTGNPAVASTDILAPLPQRFGEGLARSNGYTHDVTLPFVIHPKAGETIEGPLVAEIFLGVCDAICVPLQAQLTAEPDESGVEAAFETLPRAIPPSTVAARIDGGDLLLTVKGETGLRDAYVLGPSGWYFGEPPEAVRTDDGTAFRVPIDMRPDGGATPELAVVFDDGGNGLETSVTPQ